MYEWYLIGLELAALYFGFWYVFIKKPKVYKIKGDPWGTYASGKTKVTYREPETLVLHSP